MGNTSCFSGFGRSNRVLPTTSTVLTFGVHNNDLDLYRRHRKKDDAEYGSSVASGGIKDRKVENSKQGDFEDDLRGNLDQEMQEWVGSIILQNHLLPSRTTFDNNRHSSMRAKYADMTQMIKFFSVIHETLEENKPKHLAAPKVKKVGKQIIKKHLSDQTFNLGLGPMPVLSTRISKDAVKRNKQKDNELRIHGSQTPPPPKINSRSETRGKSSNPKAERYDRKKDESSSVKHFHVSSNWLDEDFKESILNYPKEIPRIKNNISQCSKLPPVLAQERRVKKSSVLKIEPETSEPAIHNLGLFLTSIEEDNESDPKPKHHFWSGLDRKSRAGLAYSAKEMPYSEDIDS